MTGLHCCASHGGKLFQSTKGLATNSEMQLLILVILFSFALCTKCQIKVGN